MGKILLKGTVVDDSWINSYAENEGEAIIYPSKVREMLSQTEGDLEVEINSYGGNVWAGTEIASLIESYEGKTTCIITGMAASIASVIAMAFDEIVMTPLSMIMIHNPAGAPLSYSLQDIKSKAAQLEGIAEQSAMIYHERTGLSMSKIRKMMDNETYIMADEAIKLGFATRKAKATKEEIELNNNLVTNSIAESKTIQEIMEERNKSEMARKASIFDKLKKVANDTLDIVEPENEPATEPVEPTEPEAEPEVTPTEPENEPEATPEEPEAEVVPNEVEVALDNAMKTIEALNEKVEGLTKQLADANASLETEKQAKMAVETSNKEMTDSVAKKMKDLNSLIEKAAKAETKPKATMKAGNDWTFGGIVTGGKD